MDTAARRAGLARGALYLVRPDGHVGFAARGRTPRDRGPILDRSGSPTGRSGRPPWPITVHEEPPAGVPDTAARGLLEIDETNGLALRLRPDRHRRDRPDEGSAAPPLPPQSVPGPAADTGRPYAPQAILPGGIVVPLFPPDSPYLKADKLHVPEVYNMSQAVPGRISSIVSIHNPSIEVHKVEKAINTGTAVIVIAGGGHRTLNVGGEAADFVPFFGVVARRMQSGTDPMARRSGLRPPAGCPAYPGGS